MEPLDSRLNEFFQKCSQNSLTTSQQSQEYEKILKEFDEVESKNVDKILITDQMKDTFNKMIKKLDTELNKFKLELEADNPGSAEAIELMVNQQIKSGVNDGTQRVDRKRIKRGRIGFDMNNGSQPMPDRKIIRQKEISSDMSSFHYKSEKIEPFVSGQTDALMTTAVANGSLSPASSFMGSLNTPHSVRRKFDWKHSASIINDKCLKSERKRPKMMSATSEDSGSNFGTNDELGLDESGNTNITIGSNSLFPTTNSSTTGNNSNIAITAVSECDNSGTRRTLIPTDGMSDEGSSRTPGSLSFGMYTDSMLPSGAGTMHQIAHDGQLHLDGDADPDGDMLGFDTTEEQRYCFCNDVSYGDMIACDGTNCPREWFHYGCVNLVVAPKGSWFCRDCKTKHRQRRG